MKNAHFLALIFSPIFSFSQIDFSTKTVELGNVKEAYEIRADITVKNTGAKKLYLLKADGEKGIKVFTSKKTIEVNDTALLVISFIPESAGRFSKEIKLFSSAQPDAVELRIKGNLEILKSDDKTACFYFGRPNKPVAVKEDAIVVNKPIEKRDNSNKMPDNSSSPVETKTFVPEPKKKEPIVETTHSKLPETLYKPNNLLFLVDVSNSMKDSLKLPLLKIAINKLIDDVRDIDFITLVCYADSVRVLAENINGSKKEELHTIVNALKARGLTKGRQAIIKSESVLINHYIKEGNNQMILATDGKFNFYSEDEKKFIAQQENNPIVMSVIGFGDDRDAIKNLKEIAEKGKGCFIHIKKKTNLDELLMEEVKERSRRN
ncbi:MAG: VWA domain-containing protein [Sphingobacteriaceae bacterium]|nr:VWA domain-containing protein [Sphingobacteriaceae bacterium]